MAPFWIMPYMRRHALGASKGAQYILHRARVHDTLEEALRGTFSVAFARVSVRAALHHPLILAPLMLPFTRLSRPLCSQWVTGLEKPRVSLPQLCELPAIAQRLSATSSSAGQRVALVFGREDLVSASSRAGGGAPWDAHSRTQPEGCVGLGLGLG